MKTLAMLGLSALLFGVCVGCNGSSGSEVTQGSGAIKNVAPATGQTKKHAVQNQMGAEPGIVSAAPGQPHGIPK